MGQEYSWEVRERAEELYIVEGFTFEQVAQATGVSESQLKRWSAEDQRLSGKSWPEKQAEYRQALGEIKRNSVLLRKKLLAQALLTLEGGTAKDSQSLYAATRIAGLFVRAQAREEGQTGMSGSPAESRVIKTPQDAVAVLEEVVEKKINIMLIRPETLTLMAIKDVQKSLELIEDLKVRYGTAKAGDKGLSAAAVEEIRRSILGMS